MGIAEYSIKNSVTTWLLVLFCIAGGISAYLSLSRYEDPEFTIKDALVITYYPGATPKEVEEEVTDQVETAIQQLGQVKEMTSVSRPGYSEITVTMKDQYDKHSLPQIWDELRRKVSDVQAQLPPGTKKSIVVDDYGDVFGIFFALSGKGFAYKELKEYADEVKKQLLLVEGVAKVQLTGIRQQAIFVEIPTQRIAKLGISLDDIYALLRSQNRVVDSGSVRVGDEYITIRPGGAIDTIENIGDLVIRSRTSNSLIQLRDIAKISRGYEEVPRDLVYFDGKPSIAMGVSIVSGGNVVDIGARLVDKLEYVKKILPVGLEFDSIYDQPAIVDKSVKSFLINLMEAIAIVLVVLILFMGFRCGMIISAILLLTVLGTLFFMQMAGTSLERISLGALVIALGMLVDNAIVVTEGILIKAEQGIDKIKAATQIVGQTQWPLLGATIVGIMAFAPIGLSQDATGEYAGSLFDVILISLLLSWFLALTVVPLFCYLFLKQGSAEIKNSEDPYKGSVYQVYKRILILFLRHRFIALGVMASLLFTAVWGFGFVKNSFFPNSTTPIFYIDYWRAEGSDIRALEKDMLAIEKEMRKSEQVVSVTSFVGKGAQRFMLVYSPESENGSYGQFIIRVKDYTTIAAISEKFKQTIADNYPDSETKVRIVRLGPGGGSKIEVRFSGPDGRELRRLSEQAKDIMHKNPLAIDIRDDWRQRVKLVIPDYSEIQGRLTGISREMLSETLQTAFSGKTVGLYREGDELIPIISRPPDKERLNIDTLEDLYIWSPLLNKSIPVGQVITTLKTQWDDNSIYRRNRLLTITTSCEPKGDEQASVVFKQLRPKIEAIKLPPGYMMEWGGEYEDSTDAQAGLASRIPVGVVIMISIVILLFNALKQPCIIFLTVPLSFIGVTLGLLLTGQPFDFMALLGFLSLTGMLIKNAIVLIDQIDLEISEGKPGFDAIVDSCVSRMRPVTLAAITTVLGMLPLLTDAFFVAMAVVIMFGLSFATLLTLLVVPVLYSLFFKIPTRI